MTSMWAETFYSILIATRKNETKLRKPEKTWKKKIAPMKMTSVKMRYQI